MECTEGLKEERATAHYRVGATAAAKLDEASPAASGWGMAGKWLVPAVRDRAIPLREVRSSVPPETANHASVCQ
jgi:hypothetical protein